ncbi:protein arginine N-methyltransferase 1-like [Drosophila obscura]|uniref:protein arginine N-methyltransferase 1-like n=1 Tax=Drosophila obscura TaxID=7282 RepID=UPI001BB21222|nr:protein arginine N-methyltransferase 1-like [Drosophila obscura]XP_022208859.2 protein arginine N-methyltransferase 1-like [Drosophila obscura]
MASPIEMETDVTPSSAIMPLNSAPNEVLAAESQNKSSARDDYCGPFCFEIDAHEDLLKDKVRTEAYQAAIYQNRHLFEGKIVLDIGCGTGILSMFAAEAGAAKVIAVDMAKMVHMTKQIVENNNFQDIITVIKGKIENIELPAGIQSVDIIVSEWMGFGLFHESSVLASVLYARDKWLKPNGIIFPDRCTLYIAAIEERTSKESRIDFWENVYGFTMSCMRKFALKEPDFDCVDPKQVVSTDCLIKEVDLYTAQKADLIFSAKFNLSINRNDYVHALITYFNVEFTKCRQRVGFSTSPFSPCTHWAQTVLYLDHEIIAKKGDTLTGTLQMKPNARIKRDIDLAIEINFKGEITEVDEVNTYHMRHI